MKKIFLFLLITNLGISQTVKVDYARNTILSDRALAENPQYANESISEIIIYSLIHSNGYSMYYFNKELNPKIMSELDRKGETIQDISGDFTILNRQDISNDFFFKDFKNKNFIYKMQNGGRNYDGKDVFLDWSWNIDEEYKTILNYKCQKATCEIDGVNYIAWFANEIPIMDGPYKYNGLPGLILDFSNKNFKIIAQKVSIEKENTIIETPEEPKESYTLEEMYSNAKKTLFAPKKTPFEPSKSFFKNDPNATMEIKTYRN